MTLSELRKNKKLTQAQLANLLKVKQSAVGNWESKRRVPKLEMVEKMSLVLGCTEQEILNCFKDK